MTKLAVIKHKTLGDLYYYDEIFHTEKEINYSVYITSNDKFIAIPTSSDINSFEHDLRSLPNLVSFGSGDMYTHRKGGTYTYIGEAYDLLDSEILVEYGSLSEEKVFLRPKDMFFGNVEVDGTVVPRFRKI